MVYIRLKGIIDENLQDYKKTSMMLIVCNCDWKCLKEQGLDFSICQNLKIASQETINVPVDTIIERYINNQLTKAVIIGGLEPFLQFHEVLEFVDNFRNKSNDDIVVYTGYYPDEVEKQIKVLKQYPNIIIKFGRYVPDTKSKYDNILGITLASENQFAIKIS